MSVTLKIRQALEVGGNVVLGNLDVSQSITLTDGQVFCVQGKVIADNYTEDSLWTAGEGGADTFTHGFILSDQDLWVQLRNDDTGAVEYVRIFVKANVLTFLPGKCAGNTTDALDGAILVDNTDYADVNKVEVQRDVANAIGDATVSLYLFL